MGERVWAWFEVGPVNREVLARSDAGRQLIELVDRYASEYEVGDGSVEPDGNGTVRLGLCEVNYGTGQFDQDDLCGLAKAAGLFFRQGDEGAPDWAPTIEVFTPGGELFHSYVLTESGRPVVDRETCERYVRLGGPVGERIEAHFRLAEMDVAELAEAGESGELDRLLALVGTKEGGGPRCRGSAP
jgi:hypothetical protein